MSSNARLETLKKKQQALQDQIRREKLKLAQKERKQDTRRKILVGATMLNEAERDQELAIRIQKLLNAQLTRSDDRALFNLDPLPQPEKGK